ncbi:DUF262 domain-containing protein [Taibaiella soli]|uniref:DUF262 domain-containing protein n=1 Tax=Taibaiella soli TaxID=1649169 RepID=A0A2W2ABC0_9BACT|nr:DUF262 domain-containing protein [Taibaiella soli]PZF72601.1 hypothetical protein DN068_12100 [Taibaiella soli]
MEASTTIKQMQAGNRIFVPTYQRAYTWDTDSSDDTSNKQVNTFLSDLDAYNKSATKSPYYFGHFLFEEQSGNMYGIIDGQQRLTTIVIFLSALFTRLKQFRQLTELEQEAFEDIIKRNSTYRFETVDYDRQFFKDYVIEQVKKDKNALETQSAKRIADAFDFFSKHLSEKDEAYLIKMLDTVQNATCTTHPVQNESEAIQMFIFQNNRGKKPTDLEIIKAQFMFNVHLFATDDKDALIEEIKNRFEKIYKSISSIEYDIDEDDVLVYTLRVHFNSLWETDAVDRINEVLSTGNPISFIKSFTHSLATSFEHLTTFFSKHEKERIEIHSLIKLGGIGIAIPFIIKAYTFGLSIDKICLLCSKFESIIIRNRLIGTRAEITSRLNEAFRKFTANNPDAESIIKHINWMRNVSSQSWWWSYWNNDEFKNAIQGPISHGIAKYLLWKYENHLESQGKRGYTATRFDKIVKPELEHIAPQTPTDGKPLAAGYCEYDEEFKDQYIDCLGNYLLLSKSHNCSVGNKPFVEKRNSYTHLAQQREIQEMTKDDIIWTKDLIAARKMKITQFLVETF